MYKKRTVGLKKMLNFSTMSAVIAVVECSLDKIHSTANEKGQPRGIITLGVRNANVEKGGWLEFRLEPGGCNGKREEEHCCDASTNNKSICACVYGQQTCAWSRARLASTINESNYPVFTNRVRPTMTRKVSSKHHVPIINKWENTIIVEGANQVKVT